MSKTITVYVTKYALSEGIFIEEARLEEDGWLALRRQGYAVTQYMRGEGKHWHRTMDAAVKRAEEMRVAKIKSLEKQIAKLRALKFGGA